jgi:hypothetical protein
MPDTGAPWNLPYPSPTDLVRNAPEAFEDLADAVAAGLSATGGLVEVKSVLKTDAFTSSSLSAGANVFVTGLTLSHAIASAGHKLIVIAYFGQAASGAGSGHIGLTVLDGGTPIGVGDSAGSRLQIGTVGERAGSGGNPGGAVGPVVFVYSPPNTSSRTYTVNAHNVADSSRIVYVNRGSSDSNSSAHGRTVSGLFLLEVKV